MIMMISDRPFISSGRRRSGLLTPPSPSLAIYIIVGGGSISHYVLLYLSCRLIYALISVVYDRSIKVLIGTISTVRRDTELNSSRLINVSERLPFNHIAN